MRSILLVAAIILSGCASTSAGERTAADGWFAGPDRAREVWVSGYISGHQIALQHVAPRIWRANGLPGTVPADIREKVLSDVERDYLEMADRDALVQEIGRFYREPGNEQVPFVTAAAVAADRIKGRSTDGLVELQRPLWGDQ